MSLFNVNVGLVSLDDMRACPFNAIISWGISKIALFLHRAENNYQALCVWAEGLEFYQPCSQ